MHERQLKNGQPYLIRTATIEDAKAILDYVGQIAGESNNLTFGPGEFNMTIEDEITFIDTTNKAPNQLVLVAEHKGQIVGNLNYRAGGRPRIAHTGEFGVSILKDYWGNGIGKALIEEMISWAKNSNIIKKIDLQVRDDNTRAIQLYKSLGFKVEGHISRKFYIDGQYYSVYYMGLEID